MNNTNAYIRFRALDACLRDRTKKYYLQDLLKVVNTVLYNYDGSSIQLRQLQRDLENMDRDALLGKETKAVDVIERLRGEGGKVYYRYTDPDYSMFEKRLTDEEAQALGNAITVLSQFKGLPQFEWLEETMVRLKEEFGLGGIKPGNVRFSHNPYLEGMKWYGQLFDAIVHQEVLELTYHRFGRPVRKRVVHPYQLRQWNNRWYLIGYEERQSERLPFVVLPIDRILDVKAAEGVAYKEKPEGLDFDVYFKHIIGVSLNPESKPEKVMLKATYPAVWYMETKPIHPSQKLLVEEEDFKVFEMELIPNEEFIQALLVYADQVEVMKPESLRQKIRERAQAIVSKNDVK